MKDLLFDPSHIIFEADGTRYDLVLTNDPTGEFWLCGLRRATFGVGILEII